MVGFLYWFFYFDIMFFFMSPCLCGKLNNHISTNRFAMAYRPEIAGFQPSRIECCWHWVTSSPKPNTWYSKIRCKNIIVLPKKYDHNLKYTPKLHMSLWQWNLAMEHLLFTDKWCSHSIHFGNGFFSSHDRMVDQKWCHWPRPNLSPGMKTKSFLSSDRRTCTVHYKNHHGMEALMKKQWVFLLETVGNCIQ